MIGMQFQRVALRVDALNLRERALLLIASIVVLFVITDSLGLSPIYEKKKVLLQEIEAREIQLELLHQRTSRLDGGSTSERLIPLVEHKGELRAFGEKLKSRLDSMLSPDSATEILEQVLIHENGLRLNVLNTWQVPFDHIEGDASVDVSLDKISRYEFELQLEGEYLETLEFLRALESLQWKFFWAAISFTIIDYPKASVDLEIYTLGQIDA